MRKIYFFVGESGSGKTFLQEKLIQSHPNAFTRIISTTSRSPREGEVNGQHYHFTSYSDFQDLIYKEELLQHVKFGGNFYGTQIREYKQDQPYGIFVCTPEGINDTINALKEYGIKMDYEVIFFLTSNDLLQRHGISEERVNRGEIRKQFVDGIMNGEYKDLPIQMLTDFNINEELPIHFFNGVR